MPKISVIMPAYNAEKYIKAAIESILEQTFTDFEFIIIDDGSIDSTAAIIQSYSDKRIRFCPNEQNIGVAATLNRGLELACGEYIARMDADDISLPKRFEKQTAYMDEHVDIAVCGTAIEMFCDNKVIGRRFPSSEPEKLKEDLFFSCGVAHPSVMMRKTVIVGLGGYDPMFNGMEDYELWCRVAEKYRLTVLPEVLLRYRIHHAQVTQNQSPKYEEQLRLLKRRQTEQLGITVSSEEFDAYVSYCIGAMENIYSEISALGHFFEKAVAGNSNSEYYSSVYLLSDFESVMLKFATGLSGEMQKKLCTECSLITEKKLRQWKAKNLVKKLLGRS